MWLLQAFRWSTTPTVPVDVDRSRGSSLAISLLSKYEVVFLVKLMFFKTNLNKTILC